MERTASKSICNAGSLQREKSEAKVSPRAHVSSDYRATKPASDLGWGDFDFGSSNVCPILLGEMTDGQNGQNEWKIKIKVNPTQPRFET